MRNGKIQIYLDSDDYSKFSNPKVLAKEPQKKKVRDYLIQLVEKNIIEIRYSSLTICEMIHKDKSAKHYAVQRAELLVSLSRGKVLLPIYDLFFEDALKLISFTAPSTDYAYGEENNWLDYSKWHDFTEHFLTSLISECRKAIKRTALPRQQRKQLERRFIRNNRLTPECIDVIINADRSAPIRMGAELVLFEEFTSKENLIKFLKGNLSAKVFSDGMISKMMDVQFVIQKASELEPEFQGQMKLFINNQGRHLKDALQKAAQEIVGYEQRILDLGVDEKEIKNRLRKRYPSLIQKSLLDMRESILTEYHKEKNHAGISSKEWHEKVTKSEMGSIPSLDLYLSLTRQFILDRIRNKQLETYLTDGPDLLHASYAPYCDIIRLDKRTHDLIKKLPGNLTSKLNTCFLKRPEDLPEAIESKLSEYCLAL